MSAKRLRILLVTPLGFRGHGGIDRLNDLIVDEVTRSESANLEVMRLVTRGNGALIWAPFFLLGSLGRLWVAARRKQVDLLHIAVALRGSLYRKLILSRWARFCGVPYVLHEHGAGFDEIWPSLPHFLAAATDRMFRESVAIVVLDNNWAKFISRRLPTCAGKITVIPNGTPSVPAVQHRPQNDAVQITFLGELGHRKGTPQLVEALGAIAKRNDWVATIAGNRDIEPTKKRLRELGIADRVSVPGWLSPALTADLLYRTDIFVLPTFREVLPISILEAMSYGIAIVTTPVNSIPDAIENNKTGLLVPPGDVPALANALTKLISDPDARRRFGAAARKKHANQFEIKICVARIIELWQRVSTEVLKDNS
jgi:glycosyltransferase involved in cell wall biosynthesis